MSVMGRCSGRARAKKILAITPVAFASLFVACGGSSDDDPRPSVDSLVSDVCRKMLEAPCGSAEAELACLERLRRDRDDAVNEGCESELNAFLECAASSPVGCESIGHEPPRPAVGSSCSAKRGVLSECITGVAPDCAVGFGPRPDSVSCSVTCPEFSSLCTGPSQDGPLECTCSTGPRAGVTFQATDCSRGVVTATGHTCR